MVQNRGVCVCVEILRDRDETLWGSGKLLTQRVSILRDRACLVKRGAASAERARGVGENQEVEGRKRPAPRRPAQLRPTGPGSQSAPPHRKRTVR